ncbi:MAG: hypothetical protein OXT65_02780 [Alphaproteobacteria bacterium]|nr:hypothetical protein [Alphaproteobacteria bacterium]
MPGIYKWIKAALVPLIILSGLGVAGSGVYLVAHGLWLSLWFGVLAFVLSPLIFPFLLLPAAFFSGCMQACNAVAPKAAIYFQGACLGWLVATMSIWTGVMYMPVDDMMFAPFHIKIAGLVWSATITTLPWAAHARNDPGNVFITGLVIMVLLGCALISTLNFYGYADGLWSRIGVMALLLSALLGLQAVYDKVSIIDTVPQDPPGTVTVEATEIKENDEDEKERITDQG